LTLPCASNDGNRLVSGIILFYYQNLRARKMPIYEYRCKNCGFEKEYLQKLSDAPITQCPDCGKPEMVKQVTAAGFQLKGSGWYATDFKGSPKPAPKDTEAGNQDKKDKSDKSEQPKASEQPKGSEQSGAEKSASESSSKTAPAAGTANGS
jgi:putative FmdB family regulatory protein